MTVLLAATEDSGGGSFLVSPSLGLMIWMLLAFGITLYLLYMHQYTLAAVTVAAFGPLIGFHFAIDRIKPGSRQESRVVRIRSPSGRQWPQNTSSSTEMTRAQ